MSRAESETVELEPKVIYLRREGKDQPIKLCIVEEDGAVIKMYRINPQRVRNLLADLAEYNRSLP